MNVLVILLSPLILIAASAPIGATVCGAMAISRIRRSGGRIYGLGLAIFDALVFPLLALDGLIVYACITLARLIHFSAIESDNLAIGILAAITISALADFFIIRWVWRASKPMIPAGAQPAPQASQSGGDAAALQDARQAVKAPAWALIIVAASHVGFAIFASVAAITSVPRILPTNFSFPFVVVLGSLFLAGNLFALHAASGMKQLKNRQAAVAACVIVMLPFSVFGLIAGIWALVVLSRREVVEAFKISERGKTVSKSKTFMWLLLGVVAIAALASALYFNFEGKGERCELSGWVRDADTGVPISGAKLRDNPMLETGYVQEGAPSREVYSDVNGAYVLRTSRWDHDVEISAPGYETIRITVQPTASQQHQDFALRRITAVDEAAYVKYVQRVLVDPINRAGLLEQEANLELELAEAERTLGTQHRKTQQLRRKLADVQRLLAEMNEPTARTWAGDPKRPAPLPVGQTATFTLKPLVGEINTSWPCVDLDSGRESMFAESSTQSTGNLFATRILNMTQSLILMVDRAELREMPKGQDTSALWNGVSAEAALAVATEPGTFTYPAKQAPYVLAYKTNCGRVGLIKIEEASSEQARVTVKLLSAQATTQPAAPIWREAIIPDCDTKGVPVVWDLADGTMLAVPDGIRNKEAFDYFTRLGKGDIGFDNTVIFLLRGGKLLTSQGMMLEPKDVKVDASAYDLSSLPQEVLVKTGSGVTFRLKVLAAMPQGLSISYAPHTGSKPASKPSAQGAVAAESAATQAVIPRVLKTTPAAFANDVDPSLDKITVTFDRPMMTDRWSFTAGDKAFSENTGSMFPERPSAGSGQAHSTSSGQAHSTSSGQGGEIAFDAAGTTCTMPVKLQPGKVYWVGINSPLDKPDLNNFRSASTTSGQTADSMPARPYMILFATRSADGKPTPLPEELVKQAREINAEAPSTTRPHIELVLQQATDVKASGATFLLFVLNREKEVAKVDLSTIAFRGIDADGREYDGPCPYRTGPQQVKQVAPQEKTLLFQVNFGDRDGYMSWGPKDGGFTIWATGPQGWESNRIHVDLPTMQPASVPASKAAVSRDQVIVEDLALAMLAAIRDKDDAALKALATDRIKGWPDALPQFAMEMRERFRQMIGKPFDMQVQYCPVRSRIVSIGYDL